MVCEDTARGLGYGLALSQLALNFGVVMFTPGVEVAAFTAYPVMANFTTDHAISATVHHFYPAFISLIVSGVTVIFANISLQAEEAGGLDKDYDVENMQGLAVWDHAFWAIFAGSHLFIMLLVCNPCDIFAIMLAFVLVTYFAMQGISPKTYETNGMKESINMLGYAAGMAIAFNYIPEEAQTPRSMCLAALVALDYILAIGHTWDHTNTTVRTASSCRLFYSCCISIFACVTYAIWHDTLRG